MNLNKVSLIGRVTKDPEVKSLPSGIQVSSFSLATNRVWKDKNGEKQESTDFHNLISFGKQAETIGQYVTKGQLLYIDGRLQTRTWEDKDGKKNYRTEIVLENFQFGPKAQGSSSRQQENEEEFDEPKKKPSKRVEVDTVEYPSDDINPSDIPF